MTDPITDVITAEAEDLADLIEQAVQEATSTTDRALQQQDFRLGMSDLGHCREYARRMVLQEPFTDERDKTAAFLGTIVGAGYEAALARRHPEWLFQTEVITNLPSGYAIPGHPDIVDPVGNRVLDLKTKDGLEVVKREGSTEQQRFQKHGYAGGLLQMGMLDPTRPVLVGNVYIDRSGSTPRPYVVLEPFDPGVLEEIDAWLDDVFYAVRNGEEASRDKPRDFCERYCEYFTACRLYDTDVTGLIEDSTSLTAISLYVEGHELETKGKRLKDEAKSALIGVTGHTEEHVVRTVPVGETFIQGYMRKGYDRIDIRKKPKGKK